MPGTYGLAWSGAPLPGERLAPVADDAPVITVDVRVGPIGDEGVRFDDARLDATFPAGVHVVVDRAGCHAVITRPGPTSGEELVHPLLAPVAGAVNQWLGREVLHGGAFVHGGRAVLVLAAAEGGKSSTLAWLASAGVPVLTDDLVVLDDGDVLAGPRCIDLRPEAAQHLVDHGGGVPVRDGTRTRVAVGPVPARVPVGSVVVLAWGEETRSVAVPPAERLRHLIAHRAMGGHPVDPAAVLALAGLPVRWLVRPRRIDALPDVGALLLAGAS